MNASRPFALSPALIVENLKMYWYVPVLSFVIYFMSGIFPMLINTEDDEFMSRFIYNSFNNYSAAFYILMIFVPLIAAVMMMGFIHKPSRAMVIHSQPFTRSKIFNSHILTGWLMCVLPVLLMTMFYLIFMRTMYMDSAFYDGGSSYYYENGNMTTYEGINVYTASSVFLWLFSSVAIITFFYGMYVLAGSLAGNGTMHVLLSGVFFIIIPLILWLSLMYCENFLYGFSQMPEWISQLMNDANPILYLLFNTEGTTVSMNFGYLFSAILMILLARFAYGRAPLERVGDSMFYRLFEEIITYLVVFVGMTVFGFFFYSMAEQKSVMLLGMGVGTMITFIIVKIVLNKSIRIINKQNLCSLAIYLVIAALFSAVTIYDVTGYSRRIPSASEIQSVQCEDFMPGYSFYSYNGLQRDDTIGENPYARDLSDPESVLKVLALHQYIVDNRLYEAKDSYEGSLVYDNVGDLTLQGNEYVRLTYHLKNGHTLSRYFNIDLDEEAARLINDVLRCKEYLDNTSLANNLDFDQVSYLQFYLYYSFYEDATLSEEERKTAEESESEFGRDLVLLVEDPEEIRNLLTALDQDHYNRKYTEEEDTARQYRNNGITVNGEIYLKKPSDQQNTSGEATSAQSISRAPYDPNSQYAVAFYLTRQNEATFTLLESLCREKGYTFFAEKFS